MPKGSQSSKTVGKIRKINKCKKRLLRYNKKSNYYTEIVNLITNIIYDVFNKDYKPLNHIDLIRFDYLMIYDNPYVDESLKVIGYYNELMTEEEINNPDTIDKEYNANEENNAIDVDDMGSDDLVRELDELKRDIADLTTKQPLGQASRGVRPLTPAA